MIICRCDLEFAMLSDLLADQSDWWAGEIQMLTGPSR